MVDLGFLAADILGIRLYRKHGQLFGAERKDFMVGPWEYSLWLEATSNVDENECGVFVKVTNRVWLYLMLSKNRQRIAVFESGNDSKTVIIKGTSVEETLAGLDVKRVFEYQDGKWVAMKDAKVFAGAGK